MPVSLAEGLDAVAALSALGWDDREAMRTAYAATLVKRQAHRPTFETLFDLYFPRAGRRRASAGDGASSDDAGAATTPAGARRPPRARLAEALAAGDPEALRRLAVEAVGRFGAMRGRGPGLSGWSAYTPCTGSRPQTLVDRVVAALLADGRVDDEAPASRPGAGRRVRRRWSRPRPGAGSRRRRGPTTSRGVAVRPSIDRLDFTAARKADLDEMRREIYPLARRLATRLAREQHARRRGPLDFRRTVRASISTGGVPLTTHHQPQRPHRTELVVLCDVSGSVASFAQFTLMLVYALREQFEQGARVHVRRPGARGDRRLPARRRPRRGAGAGSPRATAQAALWGRTNYGRAFTTSPRSTPTRSGRSRRCSILGDARSNYSDLACRRCGTSPGGPATPTGSTPSTRGTGTPATRAADRLRRGRADGGVPQPRPARRSSCTTWCDRVPGCSLALAAWPSSRRTRRPLMLRCPQGSSALASASHLGGRRRDDAGGLTGAGCRRGLGAPACSGAGGGLVVARLAHGAQVVHLAHRRLTSRPYGSAPTGTPAASAGEVPEALDPVDLRPGGRRCRRGRRRGHPGRTPARGHRRRPRVRGGVEDATSRWPRRR